MKKKKKKQRSNEDIDPPSLRLVTKVQKYMARSAADKLDGLLHKLRRSERKRLVSLENQLGESLLHQACRSGQEGIVDILLKHGARTESRDYGGNTPAHLAASAGHMDILMQLLQSSKPPDIDIMNDEGVSIQALADRALGMPTSITAPARGRAAGHGPRDGSESEGGSDGSMEWRRKLREAESDAEGVVDGEHGLNKGGWGPEQGLGGHAPQEESEDAWADRMWAEMSRRRRAAADQAAAAFASSQASARAERAAAAARAARNSAHILQEERARDEAWRRAAQGGRLLQGPGAAAVCDPVCDPGALRAAYEACWARLERAAAAAAAAAAGGAASHPPQATTGSPLAPPVVAAGGAGLGQAGGAADMGRDAGLQQGRLALSALPWPLPLASLQRGLDPALLREVLLHGVESPADIKRRVRAELLRWHPDKWRARVAPLVRPADLGAAQELADALSQALTQLMAAG